MFTVRAILLLLLSFTLHAEPLPINACTQAVLTHTHLTEHSKDLSSQTDALFHESRGDAYKLSMPLMVAAVAGDRSLYTIIEHYMNQEMKKQEEESAFTDWLHGRMLLADWAMNGKITRTDLLITLQRHIDLGKTNNNFTTWSAGYLAGVDYDYKDKMLARAKNLTENSAVLKSDKLWAWVLVAQAASNSRDMGTYLQSLDQINTIAGKTHVGESLISGLVRNSDSSDYPAWGIAITRLASANMGDSEYFHSLDAAMSQSLAAAERDAKKDYKARAEKLLAEVNNRLAIEHNKALLDCQGGKPKPPESGY